MSKAAKPEQQPFIGNQAKGFLFLATGDFGCDYQEMIAQGISFTREPKNADYGRVAVFEDPYGNLRDLVEFVEGHPFAFTYGA